MNLFQVIFFDVVILVFPVLIYIIYLSANKNLMEKTKRVYLRLALVSSFLLLCSFCENDLKLIPILVLSSIILLSYLEDLYILANIFVILLISMYLMNFNNTYFLLIGYVIIGMLYLVKKKLSIRNIVFVEICALINSVVYSLWIYLYNYEYFNIENLSLMVVCYIFITNIMCLIYVTGKKILNTHMTYKELQQEKQIRLSLFKITHEIKNPIAVCKGYLDMINTNDKNQVERYIPIIKSEIERLLTLLQDFLLINKKNMDLDIMDINMLIEDTVDKLNPLIKENNIDLNLNINDDEVFINGDYNRLSQVLINIIKNSIEAIPEERRGKIDISAKINNNEYYLTVEDNGMGMDMETLSKMKDPFYTTKRRGSGLGVSLIYEIVEAHKGKVEYSSIYGRGTKVKLKFPLYE